MKYSSISDENGNDQNPLKFSFEALNYYMDLWESRSKRNLYTLFNTLQSPFKTP